MAWRTVAAWQLMVELARRAPDRWLIETHPGGGQYDCLWLTTAMEDGQQVSLNLLGSIQVQPWHDQPDGGWGELAIRGPFGLAQRIATRVGIPFPHEPPRWNRRTLAYGVVSGLLARAFLEPAGDAWDARNGYGDTSGEGGGVRRDWFRPFDGARERLEQQHAHDLLGQAAYRFWFLFRRGVPVIAIETAGRAWTSTGEALDLWAMLEAEHWDLAPVVAAMWQRLERHA